MSSAQILCLENLPMEIKFIILSQITNIRSLSALVRASPTFHAAYRSRRAEILSSTVLKTLKERGLDFSQPAYALEVYSHTASQDIFVPIVFDCYQRLTRGATKLSLTIDQSISLLQIAIAVAWTGQSHADFPYWVRFFREGSRVLPEPRPAILCRLKIRREPYMAHVKLLGLLLDEGYRICVGGRLERGGMGNVMTREPYEPNAEELAVRLYNEALGSYH